MIYVFKTSVRTKGDAKKLKPHIDKLLPVSQWNFDLHDRDKILRVESEVDIVSPVIALLSSHQFYCEELEDTLSHS